MMTLENIFIIGLIIVFFLLQFIKERLGIWRWIFAFGSLCFFYIDFFIRKQTNLYLLLILTALFVGSFFYDNYRKKKKSS